MLVPLSMLSQNRIKDTVYGNVRSVREKLIFLDSVRQNYKLFANEDEYGHHGFMSREFTIKRFNTFWYTLPIVHYMNYYREYNDKQRITSETWFYKDNSFLTKYEFAYDDEGNLITERKSDEFGEIITKQWGYDHKNRVATLLKSYKTGGFTFLGYQYNSSGQLIATNAYRENEKAIDRKFEYESGKLVRVYHTLPYKLIPGDDPKYKTKIHGEWDTYLYEEYQYDEYGNKTAVTNYSSVIEGTNDLPSVVHYIYDENHNMIANSGSPRIFSFDEKNRIVMEKLVERTGKEMIQSKYLYKNENLIKLLYTEDGKTTTVTFSYKFDDHNNWTEQIKSINGKPLYVRRRKIVYY